MSSKDITNKTLQNLQKALFIFLQHQIIISAALQRPLTAQAIAQAVICQPTNTGTQTQS
jgi:hypothetical protein